MKRLAIAGTLLLGFVCAGCATDTDSGGNDAQAQYTKVFRGRWWSYYDRGSFYLGKDQLEQAAADLEEALQGRSSDSWRARTYGLHFVEYFPNRELGITYFEMERLDEAQQYLEKSLDEVDTVRARHYLDLVKEAKIAQGVIQDTQEPAIETSLPSATILATRELAFEVKAQDDNGVSEVTVNGETLYQRGSEESLVKQEEVLLEEGVQEIEVVAKDLAGKETVKKEQITIDLTGPTIGVFTPIEPTVTEEGTVLLEGAAVDQFLVRNVDVDKRVLADEASGAERLNFNSELPLGDGENTFIVASRDLAGNETRSAIKVFKGDPDSVEAKLWLLEQRSPENLQLALTGAVPLDLLLSQTETPAGSEIRVKSPDTERPYRNDNTLRVTGEVVTQSSVSALSINGQAVASLTGAPKESFNKSIAIPAGTADGGSGQVKVTIEATDASGAQMTKELDVQVQPILIDRSETKMPVAVLAFDGGESLGDLARAVRSKTELEMVDQKRFRVLERIALQEVLTEQQLSAALSDPNEALTLGKMTPAHIFLVGEVFPRGDKGLEVLARAVNTESGEIEDKVDGFVEDRSDAAAVDTLCRNLATELREKYPRRSGEVMAVAEKNGQQLVLLNWTGEDMVRPGMRFWVLHEEEDPFADFDTGEVTSPPDYIEIGQGRIQKLSSSGAQALVEKLSEEGIKLEKGMPAITM